MSEKIPNDVSFGERIKNFFTATFEKLDLTKERLLEFALYAGVGFLAGFIINRYGVLFAWLIGIVVLLFGLDQLGVISFSINVSKIQELIGIQSVPVPDNSCFSNCIAWARMHAIQVVMFTIGFLMGLRVG